MAVSDSEKLSQELAILEFQGSRNESLKEKYIALWESLEVENIPREQIAKKGHEMIERQLKKIYQAQGLDSKEARFKNDSWYYELASKLNYTPNSPSTDKSNTSHQEPNLNKNSICYDDRYNNILLYSELIKFLKMSIEQLEVDYDEIKDEKTGKIHKVKREWEKFYNQPGRKEYFEFIQDHLANMFDEWSRCLDARQALLPKLRYLATAITAQTGATISDFCTNYYALVKNKTQISPKAYRKFITEVKSYSDFMLFIQDDAWKWNVLPIKCPRCDTFSLRTRIYPNGTWDFICTNKKAHKDEEQPHFTPNVWRKMLERIHKNKRGMATQILEQEQIVIKDNNPKVK